MDHADEIQQEGEILPPEAEVGTAGDHPAPAVADEVLPDTLVLLPLPGRPFFSRPSTAGRV